MGIDRIRRDTDGAALVEAALILPILLLLVFGITDVSLYLWRVSLAEKAVQLGLRRAIVSDAVADGPGLTRDTGAGYWEGLPPGLRCQPNANGISPCPGFTVECSGGGQCVCRGGECRRYGLVGANLEPILGAMRAMLPELRRDQVRITYATNGGGYVGRPLPVPVDVTVGIVGMHHEFGLFGGVFGRALPITASATMPGESLVTPR